MSAIRAKHKKKFKLSLSEIVCERKCFPKWLTKLINCITIVLLGSSYLYLYFHIGMSHWLDVKGEHIKEMHTIYVDGAQDSFRQWPG